MNTSLEHLPEPKQQQILLLVEIIKQILPAKIVLYGSYARGDWQQDWSVENNSIQDYNSDYDFLVVLKNGNEIKEMALSDKLNNLLRSRAPVNAIVHSIDQVNHFLEFGHYFFVDIINQGILLYDSGEIQFTKPKKLSDDEKKQRATEYFEFWFPLSGKYFEVAVSDFNKSIENGTRLNFSLHNLFQAVEGLYTTFLLVFRGFKPKTHNLDKLRGYTKGISIEFDSVFPIKPKDRYDADLFEFLKRSYIGAKYKLDFNIPEKDLEQLIKKVGDLLKIVGILCNEKIKSFDSK